MMNGASIVITGAAGFTGRHACLHYLELGMKVTALTRKEDPELVSMGATVTVCDLLDTNVLTAAIQKAQPDYLLHLAGMNSVPASWKQPVQAMESNVIGTLNVLNAIRLIPHVRVVVVTSKLKTPLVRLREPEHPYALSKSFQEISALAWGKLFGLDISLVEPSNLIGPGRSTGVCALIGQYIANHERGWNHDTFLFSSRQQLRDYLDVRDAVSAYEKLLIHGEAGSVYSVQSGKLRTLGEVAATFRKYALTDILFRWQDDSAPLADEVESDTAETVSSFPIETDTGLPKAWGWEPIRSFEHSVADILNYYRNGEG